MLDHEIEESAHSERGPSTASRWRACPGSVRMSRGLPDEAGYAAAEGTVFHDFAADCLELGLDPQGFVGDSMVVEGFGRIKFDQAMADNMLEGLDFLWAAANSPGAKMIVEKRVDLTEWIGPGEFGTTDAAVIDPLNWRIIGFDWKYGQGVPVSPEENDQAILYILGAWSTFARAMFEDYLIEDAAANGKDFDPNVPWEDDIEVIIVIEQPRAPGGGGTWTTNMGWLLAEGRRIRRDADLAMEPGAPIIPGESQCKFCKAAKFNTCQTRAEFLLTQAGMEFDEIAGDFEMGVPSYVPPTTALTPEQRSQVLFTKSQITKFLDDLHAEAVRDAKAGRPTPGMKLVPGRATARKWKNDTKAEVLLVHDLGEKAWNKKLLSPAMVEDAIGKRSFTNRFARHVVKGDASPILVPEYDKREALPTDLSEFDAIEDYDNDESLV